MLLLTQSLGVSDIPDLIVAALWGVAAVLAVMTCFISKNKRAVVGLSLLALAAAMRVVAAVFSSQLNANKLSEITETALGVLTAAAAIVMLTSKNRLSRALWLTASICILLLQTGYLAVLPMSDVLNSAAAQNAAALTLKSLYYASPVFTAALLLALFLNFILKKIPQRKVQQRLSQRRATLRKRKQTRSSPRRRKRRLRRATPRRKRTSAKRRRTGGKKAYPPQPPPSLRANLPRLKNAFCIADTAVSERNPFIRRARAAQTK